MAVPRFDKPRFQGSGKRGSRKPTLFEGKGKDPSYGGCKKCVRMNGMGKRMKRVGRSAIKKRD